VPIQTDKIETINPRVHKDFVGLDCIRLIWNDYNHQSRVFGRAFLQKLSEM